MSLSLLLNSSSCLAEKVDDSRAEMSPTPPEGESSSRILPPAWRGSAPFLLRRVHPSTLASKVKPPATECTNPVHRGSESKADSG